MTTYMRGIVFALLAALLHGCATPPLRNPVPGDLVADAQPLPGVPAVRAWSGTFSEQFGEDLLASVHQDRMSAERSGEAAPRTVNILTLSGGSDSGAFGAGFLNGWTRSGNRPGFKMVTGISAGALIAPFAYLGPDYDGALQEAFTRSGPQDIYRRRGIGMLWSDALADSTPLASMIDNYFDEDFLHAVARAHRQGRRLYIGTTNLDADRLVVWNMGAIASSGHPQALTLFRQVVLASSSIPVAFPPVLIPVELDGKLYDEMHVDGGVKAQLFLSAATIDIARLRKRFGSLVEARDTRLFAIRNAQVGPEPKPTARKLTEIFNRAMSSLLKSQARSDLARIHAFAREQGFDFNWIAIPAGFESSGADPFDTGEMNRLFRTGYELGLQERPWRKEPPGFDQN